MNRKEELKQLAKEIKTQSGIYQIVNTQNQKRLIESSPNLQSLNGQQFMLDMGSHRNRELQQEWNTYGKDAFVIEVLEVLKIKEGYMDMKHELKNLRDKWLAHYEPYGERGYNSKVD